MAPLPPPLSNPQDPSQWPTPNASAIPGWVPAPSAHTGLDQIVKPLPYQPPGTPDYGRPNLDQIVNQLSYQPPVLPDYGRLKQLQDETSLQSAMGTIKPAATVGNPNPQAVGPNPLSAYIMMRDQGDMANIKDQATREQSSTDLYNNMLRMAQVAGLNNASKDRNTDVKADASLGAKAIGAGATVESAHINAQGGVDVQGLKNQGGLSLQGLKNQAALQIASETNETKRQALQQSWNAFMAKFGQGETRLGLAQDRNARQQGGYEAQQSDRVGAADQQASALRAAQMAFADARITVEDPEGGPAGSLPGIASQLPPIVGGAVNWAGKQLSADDWNKDPKVQALTQAVAAVRASNHPAAAQLEALIPQYTDPVEVKTDKMEKAVALLDSLRAQHAQSAAAHTAAMGQGSSPRAPIQAAPPQAIPAQAAPPQAAPQAAPQAPATPMRKFVRGSDGKLVEVK